ncbi:MAG: RluA family pseudouridine synthase [Chloroflexi bacterium]|nr:RluA family pseudouridine synthase [Chloroflexota bacterium]
MSRSRAQRLIREGHVLVNGQVTQPSARLRLGDLIHIRLPETPPSGITPEELPLRIVYEDPHVLVVDKPPGMAVHPGPGRPRGTLVNALLARYPELADVGGPLRPGLVHRLDADTSGLMVVARTPEAYLALTHQIAERAFTKVYLALVRGYPKPSRGTIEARVGRHPQDRKRMGVVSAGREAVTRYAAKRVFQGFTLLEVRPETGRTHQIRVHFSALGHPVAGDAKYGGRVPFLRRQFLHAQRLGFRLPSTGAYVEFVSQLPPDLEEALETLAALPGTAP